MTALQTGITFPHTTGATTTTNYGSDTMEFYSSVGGTTMLRDAAGNLRDDGTRLFEYDYANRLVRVAQKSSGSTVAEYGYDCMGRRVSKTTAAGTRRFVWSGWDLLMEYDSVGLLARRHLGPGSDFVVSATLRDVADLDGDGNQSDLVACYPIYDGAFDCVGVAGPNLAIAERYVHAYDGAVTITNSAGQQIGGTNVGWFQGYGRGYRDEETGFVYFRRRYYSPDLGRFITGDPGGTWHDEDNLGNRYAWVGNIYRNRFDPTGLKNKDCTDCDDRPYAVAFWTGPGMYKDPVPTGDAKTDAQNKADTEAGRAQTKSAYKNRMKAAHDAGFDVVDYGYDPDTGKEGDAAGFRDAVSADKNGDDPCLQTVIIVSHGYGGKAEIDGKPISLGGVLKDGQFVNLWCGYCWASMDRDRLLKKLHPEAQPKKGKPPAEGPALPYTPDDITETDTGEADSKTHPTNPPVTGGQQK